jgi:hypothetical protein
MRYCVLSIPRTGSTWLVNDIGRSFSGLKNYIHLGEFFTPFVDDKHYKLDDNKMIYHSKEITDKFQVCDFNEFNESRMDLLLNGYIKQPLVVKYMYWSREVFGLKSIDLENLKRIQNHNIKIININRNVFESCISYCAAKTSGISHRFEYSMTAWYQTDLGRVPEIVQPKIIIDNTDFELTYMEFIAGFIHKQKMADELNCVTVNYNTLKRDCFNNKIPFQSISHTKKLYNEDYNSIITNYNQLLETKEKVEKMMNFSDTISEKKL